MSANCEYYESLVSRMLDGDLLDAETDALREHVRSCRSCRALCAAFSSMTLSLRDDLSEPPASLSGSVMNRIRSYETEQSPEADESIPKPESIRTYPSRINHSPRKRNRFMPTLVAACLIIVIGGSVVLSIGRNKTAEAEITADSVNTAAYSRQVPVAEEEAPEPETAEYSLRDETMGTEAAADVSEPAEAPIEQAAEEVAGEETDSGTGIAGFDLANPATVPAGSEAAFEALLTDAGTIPATSFHAFFAVEHRGIIYEFMTDENEEYLLWRDAAEGFPTLSQSSFDDLWAIFK